MGSSVLATLLYGSRFAAYPWLHWSGLAVSLHQSDFPYYPGDFCNIARSLLRSAIIKVRKKYPFAIDAMILLPDHLHCIWTLPPNDSDCETRWRLIKSEVTKPGKSKLRLQGSLSESRIKRREQNLWQRRFWEHWIRDETDFKHHFDYIHYNPVKHGFCDHASEWKYTCYHRYVKRTVL